MSDEQTIGLKPVTLSPDEQKRLSGAIYKTLEHHCADYQVLSLFGSLFDTLTVAEFLDLTDDWIATGETIRSIQ